jgi:hypothetical protein
MMEDLYHRHGGDIDLAGKAITDYLFQKMPDYFVARDIMEGVFRQMLKFIAKNQ